MTRELFSWPVDHDTGGSSLVLHSLLLFKHNAAAAAAGSVGEACIRLQGSEGIRLRELAFLLFFIFFHPRHSILGVGELCAAQSGLVE